MTSILLKTVGIHFFIMFGYLAIGLVNGGAKFASILFIPLHVGFCLIISLILYIIVLFKQQDKNITLFHASSHLLSAIVVGIVGYSVCSTIIAPNFPH